MPSEISQVYKTSFAPVADDHTEILILGSIPGDRSLQLSQYYGHPQNRFWRVISAVTGEELPLTYPDKITLLLRHKIGLWDVAHKAIRPGSLDSAIKDARPNDLDDFVSHHKCLKIIGFNGRTPEALFDKHFARLPHLTYISLPSTSPANAATSLATLCSRWRRIMEL